MSKNLAGPISTRGPPPRILKTPTSATRNPWQLTLQILTLSSQFTSSEAQKEPQVMNFEGATNHGSKPHVTREHRLLSCLSSVGGGLHRGWRKLRWMAERWLGGFFFLNRSLYFVIWSFEYLRCPKKSGSSLSAHFSRCIIMLLILEPLQGPNPSRRLFLCHQCRARDHIHRGLKSGGLNLHLVFGANFTFSLRSIRFFWASELQSFQSFSVVCVGSEKDWSCPTYQTDRGW